MILYVKNLFKCSKKNLKLDYVVEVIISNVILGGGDDATLVARWDKVKADVFSKSEHRIVTPQIETNAEHLKQMTHNFRFNVRKYLL